jgi:pimeloyl-ACP methyl ester carboxylesterase
MGAKKGRSPKGPSGPIPAFEQDGLLPAGIFDCTGTDFIERFCKGKHREPFAKAAQDIFDFALGMGASRVLIGGSFITKTAQPRDLDVVIVFAMEEQIPDRTERLSIEGTNIDIFFCAETDPKILGGFVTLFSRTRWQRETGIVQVVLRNQTGQIWDIIQEPDDHTLEIIKRVYFNRHIVDRNNSRKALITIHGVLSHGEWNAEIAHIASSNGWIVAPFVYGYVQPQVLAASAARMKIVDSFRDHINDIQDRYHCEVSVIAHSFGTYVIAKYLLGFDVPPISLDTLILTGSVLNEDLDIDLFYGRAFQIINEVAPNDSVVKYARPLSIWSDPLFGRSGETGFRRPSQRLEQRTSDVFTHNNVIRRDVISKRWMPWLEVNVGRGRNEAIDKVLASKGIHRDCS